MRIYLILSFFGFVLLACQNDKSKSDSHGLSFEEPDEIISNYNPVLKPFYHGVASGDPLQNAVIIWTRVTPEEDSSTEVSWKVAKDIDMNQIVQEGKLQTDRDMDFTVKVDVVDLEPGTIYYYQFEALGQKSLVGRTKTTATAKIEVLQLAFASCSNYEWGFFNNYKFIAEDENLDAVIHLGDYIYEYGPGVYGDTSLGRIVYPPHEIISLSDYRYRYSQYRTDNDLIAAHQNHPFITVWDDHESANNSYQNGAQNHNKGEGDWQKRKEVASQVYYEWLPVRDNKELYRQFDFGDLLSLHMLDTRITGRTVQIDNMAAEDYLDTSRHIIGNEQFEWLVDGLVKGNKWKIIGNQVPFGPMINDHNNGEGRYLDGWDGYPAERMRMIRAVKEKKIENLVFVTGDYHSSFAFETDLDATQESSDNIGVEFVVPSINSANSDEYETDERVNYYESRYMLHNPHLKFVNLSDHGYVKLIVSDTSCIAQFLYAETVKQKTDIQFMGQAFEVKAFKPQLIELESN